MDIRQLHGLVSHFSEVLRDRAGWTHADHSSISYVLDGFHLNFRCRDDFDGRGQYTGDLISFQVDLDGNILYPDLRTRREREMRFLLERIVAIESAVDQDKFQTSFAGAFVDTLRPAIQEARRALTAPGATD